jgi:hypothetical protein
VWSSAIYPTKKGEKGEQEGLGRRRVVDCFFLVYVHCPSFCSSGLRENHRYRLRKESRKIIAYVIFLNTNEIDIVPVPFNEKYRRMVRVRGSSVSIVTRLRAGRPEFGSRQAVGIFLPATASRPTLELIQAPIHWVRGVLSSEVNQPGRLTTHLRLVP